MEFSHRTESRGDRGGDRHDVRGGHGSSPHPQTTPDGDPRRTGMFGGRPHAQSDDRCTHEQQSGVQFRASQRVAQSRE